MDKLMKATGVGLKYFFGARDSISTLKERGRQFSAAKTKLKKSEILAIMGMYAIKKGSPIGLVITSATASRWVIGSTRI